MSTPENPLSDDQRFRRKSLDHAMAASGAEIHELKWKTRLWLEAALLAASAAVFSQREYVGPTAEGISVLTGAVFAARTLGRCFKASMIMSHLHGMREEHPMRLRTLIDEVRKEIPELAEGANALQGLYFSEEE